MCRDFLPGASAVMRNEDSTAWPAAVAAPSLDIDLPGCGEQSI